MFISKNREVFDLVMNKLTGSGRWSVRIILEFAGDLRDQAPLLLGQGLWGAEDPPGPPEAPRRSGGSLSHCRWLLVLHLQGKNKTVNIN